MGISTSTGTLVAGTSRTFNLAPASAITLTLPPNCRVTITESPATVAATSLGGNATRVHNPRLPGTFTYGPYPMGGSVLVENGSSSGSTVTWVETGAIYATDSNGNVTGLVGPDDEIIDLGQPRNETLFPSERVAMTATGSPCASPCQIERIRCVTGTSVALVVYDNPAVSSGTQLYSGTLSAGEEAAISTPIRAINGLRAVFASGSFDFYISQGV